ncbi:MAG: hypothetical protein SPH83_04885 [Treponema sp.]|nr:hypothetical protein [Spirochaetales bacterium]MDY6189816.1 hypothetical protein [Treponema sp.]
MKGIKKLKSSRMMKPLKYIYRWIRYGDLSQFSKPAFFLNNSKGEKTAAFILAGYKDFTWDIVFKRIKEFCPKTVDVCIISSGVYSERLKKIAEKYSWSYISMKKNCVTLALNSAIKSFPSAEKIFKIDEDIFITEGFFEELPKAFENAKKDYFPCFSAPLIPINGYGYRQILEKLNLTEKYTELFEYPKISAGSHMQIESNPDVAKFFWGKDNLFPQIDLLNHIIKEKFSNFGGRGYSICPIRFSIGAIYFEKSVLENAGYFPVKKGNCMGLDEVFLCNLATSNSLAIVVSENQVAGHLSFGTQNESMKNYFLENKENFEIKRELK